MRDHLLEPVLGREAGQGEQQLGEAGTVGDGARLASNTNIHPRFGALMAITAAEAAPALSWLGLSFLP